jgi:hypothetical protein
MGWQSGIVIFDAERPRGSFVMPMVMTKEQELLDNVNRLRRELYAEEERAKGQRLSFSSRKVGQALSEADHQVLDAVNERVNSVRTAFARAERELARHREAERKAAEAATLAALDEELVDDEPAELQPEVAE